MAAKRWRSPQGLELSHLVAADHRHVLTGHGEAANPRHEPPCSGRVVGVVGAVLVHQVRLLDGANLQLHGGDQRYEATALIHVGTSSSRPNCASAIAVKIGLRT